MTLEIWISIVSCVVSVAASIVVAVIASRIETKNCYTQMRHDDVFKKTEMYQQICLLIRQYTIERTDANRYVLMVTACAAQAIASDEELQILEEIKKIISTDAKLDGYRLGILSRELITSQYQSLGDKKSQRKKTKNTNR